MLLNLAKINGLKFANYEAYEIVSCSSNDKYIYNPSSV